MGARISFASTFWGPGADMREIDLQSLIGGNPATSYLDRFIKWNPHFGGPYLTVSGSGLAPVIENGVLVDISAGMISGIDFNTTDFNFVYSGNPISAQEFMGYLNSSDWTGLASAMRRGDDTITGSIGADLLLGGAGNDYMPHAQTGADTVRGGQGDDTIRGSGDGDILYGDNGADAFWFDSFSPFPGEKDKINDFVQGEDKIWLTVEAIDSGLGLGPMKGRFFVNGSSASTADEHFVYREGKGKLFYDYDGSGASEKFLIIEFARGTELTAADFVLI